MAYRNAKYRQISSDVNNLISDSGSLEKKMDAICTLLANEIDFYDWVGFYLVDGDSEELVLGPFIGAETEYTRIPFGQGICGQVAASGNTLVIQDVSKVSNYLSCSPDIDSEIVVPIFSDGRIVGELDIDSQDLSPFSWDDRELLEHICARLSEVWEKAVT